jgi:hypothetical protein
MTGRAANTMSTCRIKVKAEGRHLAKSTCIRANSLQHSKARLPQVRTSAFAAALNYWKPWRNLYLDGVATVSVQKLESSSHDVAMFGIVSV